MSIEEVSFAAAQQFRVLAVTALVEGVWSTQYSGISVKKALKFLPPALITAATLYAGDGLVSSADPAQMAPGLTISLFGCLGLLASYGKRLFEKYDERYPEKEIVAIFASLAFFGFSTAFQSFFYAGIITLPSNLPDNFPSIS